MKKIFGFWLMILLLQHSYLYAEQLTQAKKEDTLKLINMTGPKKMGLQIAGELYKEMIKRVKSRYKDNVVPSAVRKIVRQETMSEVAGNLDQMVAKLIPIYAKYYTHTEIKKLIDFYQTDLGKLIISKTPMIMQESMIMLEKWGRSLASGLKKKINQRIDREGIKSFDQK